jgi:glycosyltransferase involved in cell wall biosynthesis
MSTLAVIVPVRNDAARLGRCLQTIAASRGTLGNVEILVADNGSTDDSAAVATRSGARVLHLPDLRVSELRNQATSATTSDLFAFVDADHEVAQPWIAAALDVMSQDGVGATGAIYESPPTGTWVQRMYGLLRGRTIGHAEVSWLGSGNLIVRREAFQQVGGFDATLEACEDVDLCQRLRAAGWRIIGDDRLRSVHLGDPPTLRALFRAERWRGRDNIRVSLRGPLTMRDLPSLAAPIITLLALPTLILTTAGFVMGMSWWWPLSALVVAMAFPVLQALRMASRARQADPMFLSRALLVTITFNLARALALVTRAGHHRQPASPLPANR